jgi:hypothetical protein
LRHYIIGSAEQHDQRAICITCNKALRVNGDGISKTVRYISINYFANGKLRRADYQHWRCYAREVYLDFIDHMKGIEDNPLLNQDILSDVAKLEGTIFFCL